MAGGGNCWCGRCGTGVTLGRGEDVEEGGVEDGGVLEGESGSPWEERGDDVDEDEVGKAGEGDGVGDVGVWCPFRHDLSPPATTGNGPPALVVPVESVTTNEIWLPAPAVTT